ncbi:calcyclin binding protein, putative [Eimeria necatrix]|uniref:Calcyclin binding protein, putative n=1 Tax=Eimeria necatrix TaxID=51315 RepID=U6MSA5_9EIME|nr:calcyclin binding protein, putative [Eimeria necatrix]CDJ65983.1 calcyclin binding protein, putative [Eimeria necatrix]
MESTEALRCDLEEFEAFLKLAKRPSVKSFLSAHCQRLRDQIEEAERLNKCASQVTPTAENQRVSSSPYACVKVFNTIDRFAWDQTRDLVKVYVQLDGLESLPEEATSAHFEETSAQLVRRPGEHWDTITKAAQLNPVPKIDPSADPSQSIMSMMKNLYNQTESQERKLRGTEAENGIF